MDISNLINAISIIANENNATQNDILLAYQILELKKQTNSINNLIEKVQSIG